MDLNLPIFDQLASCKNLLIAGMGGGFDIFCGLPIYFELQRRGQRVHLANFSFSDIAYFKGGIPLTKTLVGVTAEYQWIEPYFPELYLAQWFKEQRAEDITIWSFEKTGTLPLLENYRVLIKHLGIDGILLVDGGVDSLVQGDEIGTGSLVEDAISLYVVNALTEIPVRLIGCIGMGAEQDIGFAHIFQNIATLTAEGGFLGSCSLLPQMEAYQLYEDALMAVQGNPVQDPSVINSSIVSSVRGHYGDYHLTQKTKGSRLWISPLVSLYWFFDLAAVARRNLWMEQLENTETIMQALSVYLRFSRMFIPPRDKAQGPLP
jgi:hypothetical protein